MRPSRSPSLEDLLAHVDWIRALSRQLVRDPDLADEIVQQTLVRASSEGPRETASLRTWLGAVVRNFARSGLRSQIRRRHHEQRAARPEGLPSTHEIVERAALHRELVECVMELDEPYRTTLLLRFFESQSPREIARHMNEPEATVRTRLARGLALLRTRLDRRHGGDRSAWALLASPLRPLSIPVVTTIVAMNIKLVFGACALSTAALVWYITSDGTPAHPDPIVSAAIEGEPSPKLDALEVALDKQPAREPALIASTATVVVKEQPIAPSERIVFGHVLDVDSRPVAGAAIVLRPDNGEPAEKLATSDSAGNFELKRPARAARLEVEGERWYTLFAGMVGTKADQRECTIVVAPNAPFSGAVVDDAGVALADAEVVIVPQFTMRTRFKNSLDTSEDMRARTKTDVAGRFAFERAPRCEGLRLEVELAGYIPYGAPFLDTDRPFKTIQLSRAGHTAEILRGRVVDEGDAPVSEAVVAVGLRTTITDARGEFTIAKVSPEGYDVQGAPVEVRALSPGKLPAVFAPKIVAGVAEWPAYVTLKLGGKPLSLRGRVERSDKQPLAGARVWLVDSTTFGQGPGGTLQLEGWLAGDTKNAWHFVTSASDGSFALEGLLDREYTLCAVDPTTLERLTRDHVAAGRSDVVLRFAESNSWPRIEGVVVDSRGTPLAEVRVEPTTTTFIASHAGHNLFSQSMKLDGVVTDSQGRFALERVPRENVVLAFSGDGVLGKDWALDAKELRDGATSDVRIELERRMHVQVELIDPTSADTFALLDGDGNAISISLRMGSSTYFMERAPIVGGRSHVASGSERARSVVTYKDDKEVGRKTVRLTSDEITTVRL